MANTLGNYNPTIFAALALQQLEKELGLAGRVFRGYDKNPQEMGQVINLRRPSYFTAQSMPISSANSSNLLTDSVAITLDQWYGVQFGLTDKELAYTQQRIIDEHIRPAAIGVADKIDQSLNALAQQIPWYYPVTATAGVADLPALRRRLFDNQVPLNDLHLELNGEREQYFLSQDIFLRANEAGSTASQQRGALGDKLGFEIFANQNVALQQAGTAPTVGNGPATVNVTVTVGQAAIVIAASTISGVLKVGDIIQIGSTASTGLTGAARTGLRNFVVTANATVTSNTITVSISPVASHTVATGTTVGFKAGDVTKYDNLAFHRNAFALAMAPLPETGRAMGANMASISDPKTGLALRVSMWYEGYDAQALVRIDALWGNVVLNQDMAVRYIS